jgi:hypothetical protein
LVNTQHLEKLITDSGKTKTFLASKIGCSRQYFSMKCNNKAPFTLNEADTLCSELGITRLTDKEKIFFAK